MDSSHRYLVAELWFKQNLRTLFRLFAAFRGSQADACLATFFDGHDDVSLSRSQILRFYSKRYGQSSLLFVPITDGPPQGLPFGAA